MNVRSWVKTVSVTVGVVALEALIWFVGPLLAIGDVRLLDGVWPRVGLIILIMATAVGRILFNLRRRRKANDALKKAVITPDEPEGDAVILQERMKDALATLGRSKARRGSYLYDLPWYIIIGPPGAGKTTALVNSGL